MRYLLLIFCALGELMLFACIGYVIYAGHSMFFLIFVVLALMAWRDVGGFGSWKPSNIKKFLKNAKAYGL
ncbi:MAG: hypothetical protein WC919_03745 [Candidatus Paceibacterota bacterium]|jgi:hypothetical protein|nr:hypothetical protein [Candidatus Paceibacterota bacterium]